MTTVEFLKVFSIPLIVLAAAAAMMFVEWRHGGRKWPKVRGWWLRALLLNGFQVGAVCIAGVAWNGWMLRHRPWNADALGVAGGSLAGYLAITFFFYWWHRWRHESDFLWRWLHQVHHSPQRIEVITSFYKHPFEILADSALSSAILYLAVGLGPAAAAGGVLLSGLAELVYHWNVKTPYWLGFLFQRPESHCIHHEKGVHSYNYSDLPVWDMLFGTFRNPRAWNAQCGFEPELELRFPEMLLGRDIHATKMQEVRQ
ncbi:MAG TPA: sterol desaturase family protein [Terriglobales bacterium]|nr:sterol desaturase family protein [Terriglobales bacterium]